MKLYKLLLVLLTMTQFEQVWGQATYYYVGVNGGQFSTLTNWNTSPDGTGISATSLGTNDTYVVDGVGTTSGGSVSIYTANRSIGQLRVIGNTTCILVSTSSPGTSTVTITGGTGDDLFVENGSTLNFSSTSNKISMGFSGNNNTGDISGNLIFATGNSLTTTGGTNTLVTVKNTGVVTLAGTDVGLIGSASTLYFAAGSNCNLTAVLSGSQSYPFPLATWDATSNLTLSGTSTASGTPTNNIQSFGNIIINLPSVTGTWIFWGTTTGTIIKGDLSITIASNGIIRALSASSSSVSGSLTINGNLNIIQGKFEASNGVVGFANSQITVLGNTTIGSNGTLDINVSTFNQKGATFTNNGTLNGAYSSSRLYFNNSTGISQTFAGTGTILNNLGGIGIDNSAGVTITHTNQIVTWRVNLFRGTITNSNKITIGTGAGSCIVQFGATGYNSIAGGNFDVSPVFNLGVGTYGLIYSIENTSRTTGLEIPSNRVVSNITLENPNGLIVTGGNLSSSTLTFSTGCGNISTSTNNVLRITNTTTSAITRNSTTAFVNGPLEMTLPASLIVGSTYLFPIGKSTINALELVNPTTTSGGTVIVSAEVFDLNSGGTPGSLINSLATNRYWTAAIISGAGNFTNTQIRLNDITTGFNTIASSNSLTGTYNILSGINPAITASSILTTSPALTTIPNYMLFGMKDTPIITSQPTLASNSICAGLSSGAMSITSTGATSFQWQNSSNGGSTWTNISGATSASYNGMTMNTAGSFIFRCNATNSAGTTSSASTSTLTVNASLTASSASTTPSVCDGSAMTAVTHTTTGATGFGNPTGLPAGMSLAYSNNTLTISGSPSNTYNVGDYFNGGRIAYIFQPNDNGYTPGKVLIVDPQFKLVGPISACLGRWDMESPTASTSSSLGEGLNNTNNLYAAGHTNTGKAIGWAYAYTDGTYTDWFVPSKDELFQILTNLPTSYFPSDGYNIRSSSEVQGSLSQTYAYSRSGSTVVASNQNDGGCANMIIARYDVLPTPSGTQIFNYTIPLTGSCGSASATGTITITDLYTWTGATSTDPSVAGNWNPSAVPCSGANEVIPTGLTNYPSYTNLTINSGTTFTVQSGAKLDISGVLTNNGTLTLESGATLVQGASSTLAGTGTYNVQQAITGTNNGSAPSGRFWYLGSPVTLASSSAYFTSNAANVVKKRDEVNNAWTALSSGTPENLVVGKGYYTQAMGNATINFSGGLLNNGAITISGLTRTAGQGYEGFNLVSNPYPSYLNWDLVTPTNVDGTIWFRTYDGNNMVFDTYVAGSGGVGTNLSGNTATKYIPPMQSFWVRVTQGQTSGSLALDNSMRSHFASLGNSTAGLRSTNDEKRLFLRMNLLQANKKDQIIVYVNDIATNGFDQYDGEKMMQATLPQFYTSAAGKKITINGLNSAKKQQKLPITIELPTTGVHSFVIEDLEIDNGLVWLEDKQEEIIQALEPGTVYEFYANSGINSERFVLHFQLLDTPTPTNTYNEVGAYANFNGKGASVHAEAAGVVVIKLPTSTEGNTDIQIRDAAGKLVYTRSTNTLETSVQLAQANGIYYVTLNSASGVEVRKVFIQQ